MRAARLLLAVLLAGTCVGLGGCGSEHPVRDLQARAEQARGRPQKRVRRAAADPLKKRGREVPDALQQAAPEATPQTPPPSSRGRTETTQVEGYLDDVLA